MPIMVYTKDEKLDTVAEGIRYLFGDEVSVMLVKSKARCRIKANWDGAVYRRFKFEYLEDLKRRMKADDPKSRVVARKSDGLLMVFLNSVYNDVLDKYRDELMELAAKCDKEQSVLVETKGMGPISLYNLHRP